MTELINPIRYVDLIKSYEQRYSFSCGPAALHIAYKAYGKDIDEGQIATELELDEEGTSWKAMSEHPKRYGFNTWYRERANYDELKAVHDKTGFIQIIGWTSDRDNDRTRGLPEPHFSVIRKITPTHIMMTDPAFANLYTMKKEDFMSKWFDGEAKRAYMTIVPNI